MLQKSAFSILKTGFSRCANYICHYHSLTNVILTQKERRRCPFIGTSDGAWCPTALSAANDY